MNWLEPEKLDANPPPFEFWTKIIRVRRTQVIRIRMEIRI
jgi:hypothetical protein